MLRHLILCALLLLASAALAPTAPRASAADDVPAWLKAAAAASAPTYSKDVPGVVVNDESTVTVGEDGRVTTVTTYAVRLLTRAGLGRASAVAHYDTDSGGKVLEMRAWLIRPDGSVRKYGKNETIDRIADTDNLYDESRVKLIDATRDAEVGSVFGYQTSVEERPWFPQAEWYFQGDMPELASRFTLTVPAGWRASGTVFNAPKLDPSVSGNSYTWEMRGLARVEDEPSSPSVRSLAAHVAVKYSPPTASSSAALRSFDTWADVSRWYTGLADPQAALDDPLALKARELTASAKTELDKIRAIGRYVQNLQYVSIQIGIGGYRPHAAAQVFAKQYGDCKDKATLMRAMLRAVKVEAFLVLIYSGDRTRVREEWVSPGQFNHCIVAVKVSDETKAASVIQHPALGRLLIFDATDPSTPVGDLPDDEQGSFALIAAGDGGSLVRMPVTTPEENMLTREVEAGLAPDGSLTATLRERREGQSAARMRGMFKGLAPSDYTRVIERWVSGGATGAKFSKIEPTDAHAEGRFALDVEFTATAYAQSMQNRLLVFNASVLSRSDTVSLPGATRKYPVVLEANAFTETVRFKLPAGFDIDELPDPVKIDSDFGSYTASYEVRDGQLLYTRKLVQRAATIPADKYADVRAFFGRVRASEEAPVVLARK
jgi:transglutaminase-like putative cysteine protease